MSARYRRASPSDMATCREARKPCSTIAAIADALGVETGETPK